MFVCKQFFLKLLLGEMTFHNLCVLKRMDIRRRVEQVTEDRAFLC